MAEIINLRRARKTKAREAAAQQADANRVRFGRTAAQKLTDKADRERAEKTLDGARREPSD